MATGEYDRHARGERRPYYLRGAPVAGIDMAVAAMTDADRARLDNVAPLLVTKLDRVLATMEVLGFPMMVTDGFRSLAQQQARWAQGRTLPGVIVTQADGLTTRSNHQAHGDGLGHAVDCCFVVDGQPSWDARLPWKAYGAAAEALGLKWGGDWLSLHDLPHIELP